jgi:hypothetical protein
MAEFGCLPKMGPEQVTAGRDPALVASWEKESVIPQKENGKVFIS